MKRRLRIYGFGLVLGLMLAWAFFLRGRNTKAYTGWTPNNRILEEIRLDSSFQTTDKFWCEMDCIGFSSIELDKLLNDGEVKFNESQVKTWPRVYRVEYKAKDKGVLVLDFSKTKAKHFEVIKVAKKGVEFPCVCE